MSDNNNLKRSMEILRILYETTDENHPIDTYQLIDALEEAGCIRPDRKIIDPHIKFFMEYMEFGICKEKGSPNKYAWIDREFELAELKMLVDAVHSSRFISDKKSKEIIQKLKKLTSRNQAEKLDREILTSNSFKRDHSFALYSIDSLNEAIKRAKRVCFHMVDYDINMKEVLRHDGKLHEVSPYALIWNNDYYYMIGKPIDCEEVRQYRIDRMKDTEICEEKAEPRPANFNLDKYSGRVFDMFTGETATVELECENRLMNYLIDRFGRDFKLSKTDENHFRASVTVDLSPTFYAWVFQFGGAIRITAPEKACTAFKDLIEKSGSVR